MEDLFHKVLKVFEETGLWEDGVELVGSWSFLLYQRHFGVRPLPLRTQDVDFLIPWPYAGKMVDLSARLAELGFRPVTATNGSMYFVHPELKLEFLIPERGKGGYDFRLVKPLGVKAVPLRFLDMLLKDSILIKDGPHRARIPQPMNFCLHKLLIAQRRAKSDKREKDIEQAVYVLATLQPTEFKERLVELPAKWRRLIKKSLDAAWDLFPLERDTLARAGVTPH